MDSARDDQLPAVIPVIEEELLTGKQAVRTGSVRIHKKVEHIRTTVEMPVLRDVVRVSRVTLNRPISSMPSIREEGDTLIIPVVEEEVVVQKRLVLKEEIRVQRRQTRGRVSKGVTLGREHASMERLDAEGTVVARSDMEQRGKRVLSERPKSILK